jgi:hypothetical protein
MKALVTIMIFATLAATAAEPAATDRWSRVHYIKRKK